MYFKIGALKNFANFTGKIPVLESLFKKVAGIQACNFTKIDSNTGGFLGNLRLFKISNSNNLFGDFSAAPLNTANL